MHSAVVAFLVAVFAVFALPVAAVGDSAAAATSAAPPVVTVTVYAEVTVTVAAPVTVTAFAAQAAEAGLYEALRYSSSRVDLGITVMLFVGSALLFGLGLLGWRSLKGLRRKVLDDLLKELKGNGYADIVDAVLRALQSGPPPGNKKHAEAEDAEVNDNVLGKWKNRMRGVAVSQPDNQQQEESK